MRYKRTIGDPDNKAGLAPCDHALAMARAWSREQDRLDDAGDEDASNKAYAEKFRWSDEFDRLFRIRHGIKDISAGVPHESDLDAIWIGTDTSGHSVLWRYHPSLEGNAAHVIAKYFVDRLALAEAEALLARKQAIMAGFRADYARLRASWGLDPARPIPLDRWVAEANNASFGAQAAYDDLVPGFEALFAREGSDWTRFYDAVTQLSRLPRPERHRFLQDLSNARPSHPS